MRILFVHQNFPGQFKYLAPALADMGHEVRALAMAHAEAEKHESIKLVRYSVGRVSTPNIHPWLADFETKTIRAEAAFRAALQMKEDGFSPNIIIAHPGWGESLFLKDVWPDAKLGIYCEFFYHVKGADVDFDPEFSSSDPSEVSRIRWKNINNLLHFDIADAGLSPTKWQASTYPDPFRERITVVHDGIDTDALIPNPAISLTFNGKIILDRNAEVVTFVNRDLEPQRGYHIFMRALPKILAERPKAYILIIGGDQVSYGPQSVTGRSWKQIFIDEVRPKISEADWLRVMFLGKISYEYFVAVLQLSSVHVYLTYPFVLSWSLLEAMSVGCAIVASDTQPLREVIKHDETGRLVNFFDTSGLADEVCSLLNDKASRQRLGANARAFAKANYDLNSVCLPKQLLWIANLAETHTAV